MSRCSMGSFNSAVSYSNSICYLQLPKSVKILGGQPSLASWPSEVYAHNARCLHWMINIYESPHTCTSTPGAVHSDKTETAMLQNPTEPISCLMVEPECKQTTPDTLASRLSQACFQPNFKLPVNVCHGSSLGPSHMGCWLLSLAAGQWSCRAGAPSPQ